MLTTDGVRKLALALPHAEELPHFERTSFRIRNKIFATIDEKENLACIMLSPVDQSVFVAFSPECIYPVPNKWGLKGATYFKLKEARKDIVKDALKQAYLKVAPVNSQTKANK